MHVFINNMAKWLSVGYMIHGKFDFLCNFVHCTDNTMMGSGGSLADVGKDTTVGPLSKVFTYSAQKALYHG